MNYLLYVKSIIAAQAQKTESIGTKAITSNNHGSEITVILQFALFGMVFMVMFVFFLWLLDFLSKHLDFLKKLREPLKKNYFIILLLFPSFYLIYYYVFYLPQKDTSSSLMVRPETADYLLNASLTFLGTGVAATALKWLNNLAFFKKQFSEIIKSEDFSNVLSEKMKELAMSGDYLLQRNDLEEIWKRVSLCKYEQKFPELGAEIQKKIENEFYVEKSLDYYYKNFRMQINLSLEGDIVKVVEISSFTIIAHSEDEIIVNFGTTSPVPDSDGIYAKLNEDNCKYDGKKLELITHKHKNENNEDDPLNVHFTAKLKGQKRYVIERQIEMTQDLKDDRTYSFASSRIIEDLAINIKLDEKLDIFFSPVGKNNFPLDNQVRGANSIGYISRDLLLPGEKFKVFIFKKS